jgi:hypothetical protein
LLNAPHVKTRLRLLSNAATQWGQPGLREYFSFPGLRGVTPGPTRSSTNSTPQCKGQPTSLPFRILQGDFAEMQGELIQLLAKSHCATGSKKEFSLRKRQGEASGIAGTLGLRRGAWYRDLLSEIKFELFFCRLAADAVGKRIPKLVDFGADARAGAKSGKPLRFRRQLSDPSAGRCEPRRHHRQPHSICR